MGVRNRTVTALDFIAVVGWLCRFSRCKSAEHYDPED